MISLCFRFIKPTKCFGYLKHVGNIFFFLLKRHVDKALLSAFYFLSAEHDFISVLLFFSAYN